MKLPRRGSGSENSAANQNVAAFVENVIIHATQLLTMQLECIHVDSRSNAKRSIVAAWLNSLFDSLHLPNVPSEEELRRCLRDGSLLCHLMNKINAGSIPNIILFRLSEGAKFSEQERFDNVRNFLVAIDGLRLPTFKQCDLEKGSMVSVVDCLLSLREYYVLGNQQKLCNMSADESPEKITGESPLKMGDVSLDKMFDPENPTWMQRGQQKLSNMSADESPGMNGKRAEESPLKMGGVSFDKMFEFESLFSDSIVPNSAISNSTWMQIGQPFQEVMQVKAMTSPDVKSIEKSKLLKSIDKTPPKPLWSVVRAVLGDKQIDELHNVVEVVLKNVMEKFELCLLNQQEHIKELKHMLRYGFETMKRKYQENVEQLQSEKREVELGLQKKIEEIQDKEIKERLQSEASICALQDELETMKKKNQENVEQLQSGKSEVEELQKKIEEIQDKEIKQRVQSEAFICALKDELETTKRANKEELETMWRTNQKHVRQLQLEKSKAELELQKKIDETQNKQIKERVESESAIRALKYELETVKQSNQEELEAIKRMNQENVQKLQSEKREVELDLLTKLEENHNTKMRERVKSEAAIRLLKDELETMSKTNQEHVQKLQSDKMEVQIELQKKVEETIEKGLKERLESETIICALEAELETMKKTNEEHVQQLQSAKKRYV
ncbi:hypothetical protein SUGI_0446720 [Cryptomeria japonica]|nr:hypothetical protein SUGI_0446700 [Cryptomeria japonica]GLJ23585.1 hypothetical protein SUGI_0446710 [Cryptomeria japonica]GLJ23586.1 hypothetical protein SUGI_0446720 [Cryptomeria japonica]